MDYGELGGFIVAALALIGSPGPSTMSLAGLGAAFSFGKSRGFLVGTIAGAALVSICVGAGLLTAVLTVPYAATGLVILSGAVMLYIAYRIATAAPPTIGSENSQHPGFTAGLVLNLSNPKAYAAFAAPVAAYELVPGTPIFSTTVEVLITLTILALVNTLWLFLGNQLQNVFRTPVVGRAINIGFALLLLASVLGVFLWLGGWLSSPHNLTRFLVTPSTEAT